MIKRVVCATSLYEEITLHEMSLTYKKHLSTLCLEPLELRCLKADLIMCFKILV